VGSYNGCYKVIISIGLGNWTTGLLTDLSWTVLNVTQEWGNLWIVKKSLCVKTASNVRTCYLFRSRQFSFNIAPNNVFFMLDKYWLLSIHWTLHMQYGHCFYWQLAESSATRFSVILIRMDNSVPFYIALFGIVIVGTKPHIK